MAFSASSKIKRIRPVWRPMSEPALLSNRWARFSCFLGRVWCWPLHSAPKPCSPKQLLSLYSLLGKTSFIFRDDPFVIFVIRWLVAEKKGWGVTDYIKSVVMHDSGRAWSERSKCLWPRANVAGLAVVGSFKMKRQTGRRTSQHCGARRAEKHQCVMLRGIDRRLVLETRNKPQGSKFKL